MAEPSRLIKVLSAFVAGVVVALGSALIYVRATAPVDRAPVAHKAPPVPDVPQTNALAQPQASQDDATALPHAAPASARRPDAPLVVEKPRARKRPVMIASAPAVSEPQAPAPVPIPGVDQATNPVPAAAPAPAPPPQPEPQPAPPVQQQYTPAPDAARQPHVVTLPAGTTLNVRLLETLSTDHNYIGDTFRASLESPVIQDGFIIADKGSKVLGRIANAQKAGRVEGVSDLSLTLTEINTTDGQRVTIQTSAFDQKGQTSVGEDTAKIAGGAALGAIIGAVAGGGKGAAIGAGAGGAAGTGAVLVTRGKPAAIRSETRLSFRILNPVTITEKLNY